METPLVSIIIPCYNQGEYLLEALHSCFNQSYKNFEIIIINDGSNENKTNELIDNLEFEKTIKIKIPNSGVSQARNIGIQNSSGEYILPLDSDDKIGSEYLLTAVTILQSNDRIGIVTCLADLFGDKSGPWTLPNYEFPRFLLSNCIFITSLFRKKDWERVGGFKSDFYDEWEDYDFWLSIIELGREVYTIPEVLFYYRKGHVSRTQKKGNELFPLYERIVKNHKNIYLNNIVYFIEGTKKSLELEEENKRLKEEQMIILNSFSYKIGSKIIHLLNILRINKLFYFFKK